MSFDRSRHYFPSVFVSAGSVCGALLLLISVRRRGPQVAVKKRK
jgi:hypothetical protein